MSEWDQWVSFVLGHGANAYYNSAPQESPSVWHIQIGSFDGAVYAKSDAFDGTFDQAELAKMSAASNGDETDIFGNPPKGYTILRQIPAGNDINVLTGKRKNDAGRLLFVARATSTLIVALVDITNSSRGCESKAMDAMAFCVNEAVNAGI